MVVVARLDWILRQLHMGRSIRVHVGPALDKVSVKYTFVLAPATVEPLEWMPAQAVEHVIYQCRMTAVWATATDRGHKHSDGTSVVAVWMKLAPDTASAGGARVEARSDREDGHSSPLTGVEPMPTTGEGQAQPPSGAPPTESVPELSPQTVVESSLVPGAAQAEQRGVEVQPTSLESAVSSLEALQAGIEELVETRAMPATLTAREEEICAHRHHGAPEAGAVMNLAGAAPPRDATAVGAESLRGIEQQTPSIEDARVALQSQWRRHGRLAVAEAGWSPPIHRIVVFVPEVHGWHPNPCIFCGAIGGCQHRGIRGEEIGG